MLHNPRPVTVCCVSSHPLQAIAIRSTCLLIPLHLVKQVTGKGGAGPPVLVHAGTAGGFEAEDAIIAGDVAGHGDTALPGVGGRGTTLSGSDGASTHVIHGRLRSLGILVRGQ